MCLSWLGPAKRSLLERQPNRHFGNRDSFGVVRPPYNSQILFLETFDGLFFERDKADVFWLAFRPLPSVLFVLVETFSVSSCLSSHAPELKRATFRLSVPAQLPSRYFQVTSVDVVTHI